MCELTARYRSVAASLSLIRSVDFEQHVAQHGHGALLVGYALAAPENAQKVFLADDNVHRSAVRVVREGRRG
jgi:hypothetical protein